MKAAASLIVAASLFLSIVADAAQVAQARLYCLSVRLRPAPDEYGDILTLTSTGSLDAGKDELIAWSPPPELQLPISSESYASGISLYDSLYQDYSGGRLDISIEVTDTNLNRHPDFFEVANSVNAVRPYGSIDITGYGFTPVPRVSWLRAAGSRTGSCVIKIDDGYWGTFNHTFEIMEYKGTLTYTPGSNDVTGSLNLTQTGLPANTLQATLQFVKTATNKFNELTLQTGSTTGALLSTLNTFTNHVFTRDAAYPTNYAGYFEFSDGEPLTYEPYSLWVLSITDTNDSDGNGIPDFSDDPSSPARAAQLSVNVSGGSVQLSIRGDVGRQYEIQDTGSLSSPNWQPVQTVTLSSDPQTVQLPVPTATKFWRVVSR